MDSNYYKEYYSLERNHWWFKARGKIIMMLIGKQLKQKTNLKVLNIGAATGKSSELLSKFGTVTSLEYDIECCDFANQQLQMNITQGSISELPYADNSFDLVCAFDVIEHVEDDVLAIAEMKRVCNTGGSIVVTVPAFMSLWSQHDVVNHHFRRYTKKNLSSLFHANKIAPEFATYFNTILFIPIYLFRQISKTIPSKWIRKGAGSDATITNEKGFVNGLMYKIFSLELIPLSFIKFPFGVSIFLSTQKK
jgi:ubiquinone/menaquinone biosynthesis C-methylase UbiE